MGSRDNLAAGGGGGGGGSGGNGNGLGLGDSDGGLGLRGGAGSGRSSPMAMAMRMNQSMENLVLGNVLGKGKGPSCSVIDKWKGWIIANDELYALPLVSFFRRAKELSFAGGGRRPQVTK